VQPKDWDEVLAVNVTANWQLIRALNPLLQRSDAAHVVFVTSGASALARAYRGPYSVSKAAIEALARTYAAENAATKVRVNLHSPGPTRTRLRAMVMPGEDPLTLPTAEDVAETIVPLCLPSSGKPAGSMTSRWQAAVIPRRNNYRAASRTRRAIDPPAICRQQNGAPGNSHTLPAPMEYAKVSVNTPGPIMLVSYDAGFAPRN
jgi:NAD(P)-dependent dehydrogenase (short-subunit alcohol dehydrogenase family)